MTRKYIRKSKRRIYDPEKVLRGIQLVRLRGKTIREAAKETDLCVTSLMYHLKKFGNQSIKNCNSLPLGYRKDRKTLTGEQEEQFTQYLCTLSTVFIGLKYTCLRNLVYDWSKFNNIEVPSCWEAQKSAGIDWRRNFLKRHEMLIYDPKDSANITCIAHPAENVESFYPKFAAVVRAHNFKPQNVWNMDQMSISTKNKKGSAEDEKSSRSAVKPTTGDKGEKVTAIFTISATGNAIPPVFIFPRQALNRKSLENAPQGSCGLCNSTGWMNADHLLEYLKHFTSKTRCSKEEKHLLLVDSFSAPVSVKSLEYARENGIVMLSFPIRSTGKLQPLHKTVFKPMEKFISCACEKWKEYHRGRRMTVDNIPSIVSSIYSSIFTPDNIQRGYELCGIYPFNKEAYTKIKYQENSHVESDDLESDYSDSQEEY